MTGDPIEKVLWHSAKIAVYIALVPTALAFVGYFILKTKTGKGRR